jgi:TRAP-type C4-dicarboxylate transport system permease small subunit
MQTIISLIRGLARYMYSIAGIALASIVFLTVADVILRAFKRPIVGTYEIVSLLGAVVIGFSVPQTSIEKGHVLMDFLTGRLPFAGQRIFHFLSRLLAIFVFFIIGWNLWLLGLDLKQTGTVSLTLKIPEFPVAMGVSICSFIQCLVLATDLILMKEGKV